MASSTPPLKHVDIEEQSHIICREIINYCGSLPYANIYKAYIYCRVAEALILETHHDFVETHQEEIAEELNIPSQFIIGS